MSNQPPKSTAQPPAKPAGQEPRPAQRRRRDEDELHVPRGVSRGVGLFLIGLMLFLLVIWLVPNAMLGISGGAGRNPVVVRFQVPGEGKVEWRYSDTTTLHRFVNDGLEIDPYMRLQFGFFQGQPDPKELTRILVLDRIARAAGIEITDSDLAGHIRELLRGGKDDDFKNYVQAKGLDEATVEESIRALMRVQRFQQLVGFAGAVPDPKEIEKLWHEDNVEFAFDFVALPVDGAKEDAQKEMPEEAGLQAWFDKLPDAEKEGFKTPEKRKAELALFRDAETTPAAELLAAFPEKPAEGAQPTAPDALANQYYNRVFPRRFAKPKVEGATAPPGFFTFDEVKPVCLAEAPVYFAMQRWLEDLNQRRANGETIDFAAEAQKYGLEHRDFPEALTSLEYTSAPDLGDRDLANAIFSTTADGSFWSSPLALAKGLLLVRVNERTEPSLPPFSELKDKAAEKWLEPKCQELAKQRLAKLREGLEKFEPAPKEGETPPPEKDKAKEPHYRASAEAFRAAAEAAGLTVATRDYLNKSGPVTQDPQASDPDHQALTSQAYTLGLYQLEPDEVAAPGLGNDQKRAYLVRRAGKRDVPIENMSPTQYKSLKSRARSSAVNDIGTKLDLDFLRKNYGLWLYEDDKPKDEGKK